MFALIHVNDERRALPVLLLLCVLVANSAAQEPAAPRPLLTCEGHGSEVYSVCFSPDGRKLASASAREVKIWDSATGKELLNYPTHGTNVFGLAFHPDSQKLAVSVSHEVRIVDISTGKEGTILKCAPDFLFRICFSPNGRFVAAAGGMNGSAPGNVHVWEADSGKQVFNLAGHSSPSLTVAYSGDGRHLASGSGATTGVKAGEVCIWDSSTGEAFRVLRGHTTNVYGVTLSRDGRLAASASGTRGGTGAGELKMWEVLAGKELFALSGHSGTIYSVTFSPDGRRLATGGLDKSVRIWDTRTGKEILNIPAHGSGVYSVAFSPDGARVASAGQDRSVRIWEAPAQVSLATAVLTQPELKAFWADLAGEPAQSHQAMWRLAESPDQTLPLLQKQLRPVAPLTSAQQATVAKWLNNLDDARFATREQASRELAQLGERAAPALRERFAITSSAEVRKRTSSLLNRLAGAPITPEQLQELRAIAVLESIGTAESKVLLKELASGVAGARLTEEAQIALNRSRKASTLP